MLSFSNFNKHLSAVRETHAVVQRAVELSKGNMGDALEHTIHWLESHNIVGQLLRANLHQKQYVDQVKQAPPPHVSDGCINDVCSNAFQLVICMLRTHG